MPRAAEQARKLHERRRRAFLAKLRADLIFFGADPFVVRRMRPVELLEARGRRVRDLMDAPRGGREEP